MWTAKRINVPDIEKYDKDVIKTQKIDLWTLIKIHWPSWVEEYLVRKDQKNKAIVQRHKIFI